MKVIRVKNKLNTQSKIKQNFEEGANNKWQYTQVLVFTHKH